MPPQNGLDLRARRQRRASVRFEVELAADGQHEVDVRLAINAEAMQTTVNMSDHCDMEHSKLMFPSPTKERHSIAIRLADKLKLV